MNRRRVLTIVTAILLTLFGTLVLIAYVRSAENRAQQGAELVNILVAAEEIPAGTSAAELSGSSRVAVRQVPQAIRAGDAVQPGFDGLADQVTLERILEGEPIVTRQFGDEAEARRSTGGQAEAGQEIITVALEPQRALGGVIAEGDLVGVIVSIEDSTGGSTADATESGSDEKATSAMVLSGVPVTAVSGADPEVGGANDVIMVSLQVDEPAAERIAFGAEFGRLWLTRQGEGEAPDRKTRRRENLFTRLNESVIASESP